MYLHNCKHDILSRYPRSISSFPPQHTPKEISTSKKLPTRQGVIWNKFQSNYQSGYELISEKKNTHTQKKKGKMDF